MRQEEASADRCLIFVRWKDLMVESGSDETANRITKPLITQINGTMIMVVAVGGSATMAVHRLLFRIWKCMVLAHADLFELETSENEVT